MAQKITWQVYTEDGYEELYPKTTSDQIIGDINATTFNGNTYQQTVDDILGRIPESGLKVTSGTYVGVGNKTKTLNYTGITPILLMVSLASGQSQGEGAFTQPMIVPIHATSGNTYSTIVTGIKKGSTPSVYNGVNTITVSSSSISWTNDAIADLALNTNGKTYEYAIIGS